MSFAENLFENLLVVGVLFTLFILVYTKITGKTLIEIFREIRDAMRREEE